MALIKCSECGSYISEKAIVCPKCGCPLEVTKDNISKTKKKNIKRAVIKIAIMLVLAVIICVIVKLMNRPSKDGFYQKTKWGMKSERVKQKLGEDAKVNEEKKVLLTMYDYDGKVGIDAMISCDCQDDSLKKVTVFLTNGDDSSYTDSKLIYEYMKEFNSLYGEAQEDGVTTYWETSKSKIELSYLMDGVIILSYADITIIEK